jgi:hypothetical protein
MPSVPARRLAHDRILSRQIEIGLAVHCGLRYVCEGEGSRFFNDSAVDTRLLASVRCPRKGQYTDAGSARVTQSVYVEGLGSAAADRTRLNASDGPIAHLKSNIVAPSATATIGSISNKEAVAKECPMTRPTTLDEALNGSICFGQIQYWSSGPTISPACSRRRSSTRFVFFRERVQALAKTIESPHSRQGSAGVPGGSLVPQGRQGR